MKSHMGAHQRHWDIGRELIAVFKRHLRRDGTAVWIRESHQRHHDVVRFADGAASVVIVQFALVGSKGFNGHLGARHNFSKLGNC